MLNRMRKCCLIATQNNFLKNIIKLSSAFGGAVKLSSIAPIAIESFDTKRHKCTEKKNKDILARIILKIDNTQQT